LSADYYLNFIKLVLGTINKDPKEKSLTFFKADNISLEIYCKILSNHYIDAPTYIEELAKGAQYGSRVTIKKKVNDAIAMNFLNSTQSKEDKRKIAIVPSNKMIKEFETHVQNIRDVLSKL